MYLPTQAANSFWKSFLNLLKFIPFSDQISLFINEFVIVLIIELVVVSLCFIKEETSAKITKGTKTDGQVGCNKQESCGPIRLWKSGLKFFRELLDNWMNLSISDLA